MTLIPVFHKLHSTKRLRGTAFAILPALVIACSGGASPAAATPSAEPSLPLIAAAPTPTLSVAPVSPTEGLLANEPGAFGGYTLFALDSAYLIDSLGRTVQTWTPVPDHAKLLANGNLLIRKTKELDARGNVVWNYPHPQHHDFLQMPNGNVLILSRVVISREEAVALGVDPDNLLCATLKAAFVVEVRPTGPEDGEVIWQWSAFDHLIQDFDPEKSNYGTVADHPELIDVNFNLASARCRRYGRDERADWLHANALDYNAELDQIMVTVRHFSEVWVIDHSTSIEEAAGHTGGNSGKGGDLLYRWGNPRAYRRGTVDDQRLFWPHNGHWIPEGLPGAGNVLVFNNGNEYPGLERGYSSVDEFALPADGYRYRLDVGSAYGPSEVVWRYAADPPGSFHAPIGSGAQRLPNGATLITDAPGNRFFEVTREGKNVWEFVSHAVHAHSPYRSYRYAPDHPGVQALFAFHRAAHQAATAGEPAARSVFDIYLTDDELAYVKEACDHSDTEHRFFLRIAPERAEGLQRAPWEQDFDQRDFDFFSRGALFDGKCMARVPLPDYSIASIQTGQIGPQGELWSVEFPGRRAPAP